MVEAPPHQMIAQPAISPVRYAIAFLLPLTALVRIQVVGTLFLHDIFTPLILVGLWFTGAKVSLRPIRTVGWLITLWLVAQVLTDLIRDSVFEDYSRGWLRIVLFGLNVLMLWLLSKGRLSVLSTYLAGTGVALVLTPLVTTEDIVLLEPWKFAVGSGLVMIAAALGDSPTLRKALGQYLPALLIGLLAAFSLWNNARSLFAIMALAAAYFVAAQFISANPRLRARVNPVSFGVIALAGLLSTQLLTAAYGQAAQSGALGDAAARKYFDQGQADVNLLVGGRPELLVSLEAIADSPIIGHGSWAQDRYYVVLLTQRMKEVGLYTNIDYYLAQFGALIPSHSHLFGAWVESGIGGTPVWFWAIFISIAALYRSLKVGRSPSALVVLTAFFVFWDVLFSPFGASARFLNAAQLCILLVAARSVSVPSLPRSPVPAGRPARLVGTRDPPRRIPVTRR